MSEMTLQSLREKAASFEAPVVETPAVEEPQAEPTTEGPAVVETAAKEPASAAGEGQANGAAPESKEPVEPRLPEEPAEDDEPAEPSWAPVTKYKAADQEHELPEWAQKAATKENHKEILEVFQMAKGLPQVKERLAKTSGEYQQFKAGVQDIVTLRDKDLGKFFARTGVTKEKLAAFLQREVDLEQMSPEDRHVYTKNRELQEERDRLSAALESTRTEYESSAATAMGATLDSELAKAEVAPLIKAFNERSGDEEAFRNLVIRHGQMAWNFEQRELKPHEAVSEVLAMLGQSPAAAGAGAPQPSAAAAPQQPRVITAPKPAVLPRVPNGTQSPTGTKVKSLADLKARAKAMNRPA